MFTIVPYDLSSVVCQKIGLAQKADLLFGGNLCRLVGHPVREEVAKLAEKLNKISVVSVRCG
jgi:hypothetical protein